MYHYHKVSGCVLRDEVSSKGFLDTYDPPTSASDNWQVWITQEGPFTCQVCMLNHRKIYSTHEILIPEPPVHENCHCRLEPLRAVEAGVGTKDGNNGADWWLTNFGVLPDYYITKPEIEDLGWKPGRAPKRYAPGKMFTRGIYDNSDNQLPHAPGRVWYEADINYYEGRRNTHRVVWSNDSLVFVTYDHYETFIEVVAADFSGTGRKAYKSDATEKEHIDLSPYVI